MRKKLSGQALLRPIGFLLRRMLRYPGLMLLTLLTLAVTTAATLAIPYLAKLIINDCILEGDIPGLLRLLAVMGRYTCSARSLPTAPAAFWSGWLSGSATTCGRSFSTGCRHCPWLSFTATPTASS